MKKPDKKEKAAPKKTALKLPKIKKIFAKQQGLLALVPVLPQLLVITVCLGIYYAMIQFYLFFEYGAYIYYALKLIIAYEILSAATKSLLIPGFAFILAGVLLFTNCIYLNTLMNRETTWELLALSLVGILITLFFRKRSK